MDRFIKTIVKEAGDAVFKRLGKDGAHYMKSDNIWDVVTKADLLAEKIMLSEIKKKFPHHGYISEEAGTKNEDAEYVWVMDPIDGTLNFSKGLGLFGVMVCLVHRREVILTAIYLPAMGELFFAKKGKGAYLNGKKIHCSTREGLDKSFGMASSSLHGRNGKFLKALIAEAEHKSIQLGHFGSIAVNACYAACGRRDFLVALVGHIWDFAPITLLLSEAGCTVTDLKGNPWKFGQLELVAANPLLHKELLAFTRDL